MEAPRKVLQCGEIPPPPPVRLLSPARIVCGLAGDSNVTGGGGGLDPHWSTFLGTSIDAAWDATLHVRCGNLALSDGSVQQSKTPTLRDQITACWAAGLTNVVFSKPRGVF